MDKKRSEITVAKTAGFCWGVKRAMDITLDVAKSSDEPVYTHGPLIHNPQVIDMLEGKQVYAVNAGRKPATGNTIIIRTHGVTPDVRKSLKEDKLKVSDATCPLVANVQGRIKKYAKRGFVTVIVGDEGHAEVVGLTGYATAGCHVVADLEEVNRLPHMQKVCVVAQTTCDTTRFDPIAEAITNRFEEVVIHNTICDATIERQTEVIELAGRVSAMVVVGGKNSANTARLATLAREGGADTFLIETEKELTSEKLARYDKIGITAGASTPAWMIERVTRKVEEICAPERDKTAIDLFRQIASTAILSYAYLALGAGMMVLFATTLAGMEFNLLTAYQSAAFLFSMYVLNQITDVKTFAHNEPKKLRFYMEHKQTMTVAAVTSGGSAALSVFMDGPYALAVFLVSVLLGLGYTVRWFPKAGLLKFHRLKDIPASKDIFVATAWAVMTVILPALSVSADLDSPSIWITFGFVFSLVYIRTVLSDIRDIEGDRLVGRETIPILIGKKATKYFLGFLSLGSAFLLSAGIWLGLESSFVPFAFIPIAYTMFYLYAYHTRRIVSEVSTSLMIDSVFHISGFVALLWLAIS